MTFVYTSIIGKLLNETPDPGCWEEALIITTTLAFTVLCTNVAFAFNWGSDG